MKIKHFSGYGSVTATKINDKTFDGHRKIVIRVKGNHERGLCRDDAYDAFNWLIKRHYGKTYGVCDLFDFRVEQSFEKGSEIPFLDYTEVCDYTFIF